MPRAPELGPALGSIVGDRNVTRETAAYAVDGLVPSLVASPRGAEELAATLALIDRAGAAVVPWGGGRHMALGDVPTRYDVALSTKGLDRIVEYEPTDLTVTVEAGITIGRLQTVLGEQRQFLPIDAPDDATIGGVLAAGLGGPSVHTYGVPRDWLIGCRVAHCDGAISKGGGRVVKNVAGYDMPKLAVGALGTLGVIVEATFKLAPLPAAQETLLVDRASTRDAVGATFAAHDRGLALRAVAVVARQAAFWLAGPVTAVERTSREIRELCAGASVVRLEDAASHRWWAQLVEAMSGELTLRASLLPSETTTFVERVTAVAEQAGLLADVRSLPTIGLALAGLQGDTTDGYVRVLEEVRNAAIEAGGSLIVTSAPVDVKARVDVWGDAGASLTLMRRLKEQFDPRSTLNPGRFVGGL